MDHLFRMNWSVFLTLCLFALTFQETLPNPTITDLSYKNMDFAVNFYRRISSYHDQNIFFSPLSISTSFSTLLMATGGVTREEILNGLNLQELDRANQPDIIPQLFQLLHENITQNGSLKLDQAMAMFVSANLNMEKTFEEQMEKYFEAEIKTVNFSNTIQSVAYINNYIKDKTKNRIKNMISALDTETQLMLLNTIFFRGDWKSPFDPKHTKTEAFYIDNYNMVNVQMMYKEARFFMGIDRSLGAKVLKLPYDHGVSMLILLPNKGVDYTAIDDEINAHRFQGWLRSMREIKVEVHLPKFKMEESYELHNLLPDMGISTLFMNTANLTNLQKDKALKVSEVLHKAMIDVDETGTTAAAATTVGIIPYSLPPSFIANRPFFFFIYHEDTNALLFMGRLIDPTKS
ncbi:protein Z-dependent protease inhibitor [Periophthalmus magnuspinnatus]|uniref:protein Z-dependent protease inhibitor n=1 Tax=Periophthalmus magnuspinnatus TaxID=409849 RepID=UPI00243723B5|nr:protein Z-dependent protease inhibitor [Periophthalmus magnuspinnatus]